VHETSFLERDVDRHLGHLDDRHLDDLVRLRPDHPDVLLHQHLDHLDDQHHRHRTEDDRLDRLDEHLDRLDEHYLEPKDAEGRQYQQGHDLVQYPTNDRFVHLRHHPGDQLLDQLDA